MKDRLEQLKAVSPAVPRNPAGGGCGGCGRAGEGLPFAPQIQAGAVPGARPALPKPQPHPCRFRTLPTPRGHVPVIHRWAAISLAASSLCSVRHPQAGQRQSRAGIGGTCLGLEGLPVRSGVTSPPARCCLALCRGPASSSSPP